MRMIVGTITAVEHRGWLRIAITANTGEVYIYGSGCRCSVGVSDRVRCGTAGGTLHQGLSNVG